MSDQQKSCLVEKLSAFVDLDDVDSSLLARLEKDNKSYKKQTEIWTINDEIQNLHVVQKGWLISYTVLQDGRRQVLEIHYPGDVIGMSDIPFRHSTSNLIALEDCVLCPFPKSEVDVIFAESPRLTALLFTLAMIDKAVNLDRLRVLGRMSARERLAHILLEIHSRLTLTRGVLEDGFRFPLSQFDLADALGLTNVSVSNAFGKLEKEQLISRDVGNIKLLEVNSMIAMSDYINRYREVDISWFPNI